MICFWTPYSIFILRDWKASLTNLLIHHNSGKVRRAQPSPKKTTRLQHFGSRVWESDFPLQHQDNTLDPRRGLLCNYSCKSMSVNDVYIDSACVRTRIYPLLFAYFQIIHACKLQVLGKKNNLYTGSRDRRRIVCLLTHLRKTKRICHILLISYRSSWLCVCWNGFFALRRSTRCMCEQHPGKWEAEKQWSGYSFSCTATYLFRGR